MKNKIYLFLLICILLIPSATGFAQAEDQLPVYVIRPGDSLGTIAALFNTTVSEILLVNNIDNADFISPGQEIKIPGMPGISGTLQIVTPSLGERFSLMPVKYLTDRDPIISINRIVSPTQVFPGTELIIPVQGDGISLVAAISVLNLQTGLESAVLLDQNQFTLGSLNKTEDLNQLFDGQVIFSTSTDNNSPISLFAPAFSSVELSQLPLTQGTTAVAAVKSDSPVKLSGTLGDTQLLFFNDADGYYYSLQGIHALEEPGLVEFSLTGLFEDGVQRTYTQQVLLTPGLFQEDPPLVVDPNLIDPSVTLPENEMVFSLIEKITPSRFWNGIFNSPAVYQEYNSLFGTRRWYNDDPEVKFHTGIDFAGGMTLPITAPAPGRVVFAGPLVVRGNTVFIDHGWGVFSGFFHQDTLNVSVGDMVETGDVIGTVGNTGRVNGAGDYAGAGAHLHWEVWVNKVQVDPLEWLLREFP